MAVLTSNEVSSKETTLFPSLRKEMVERDIAARGVRDDLVLDAMRKVPRELFLPKSLREFAYEDSPLPIAGEQTISQPYIVACMVEALMIRGGEKVLEIGAGSGTPQRCCRRSPRVSTRSSGLGHSPKRPRRYSPSSVMTTSMSCMATAQKRGRSTRPMMPSWWPPAGRRFRNPLRRSSRSAVARDPCGGGSAQPGTGAGYQGFGQRLSQRRYCRCSFFSLIGEEGWENGRSDGPARQRRAPRPVFTDEEILVRKLADAAESFSSIETSDLDPLMERIGSARIALLGEATHGTSEFYQMRARITGNLIVKKGFNLIAIEADWPDAARVDHYVRHFQYPPSEWTAFARFPTWMWRNTEVRDFVSWLRKHNGTVERSKRVAFHGLDLYSLYDSIRSVLNYLDDVDPESARVARERYGCLTPWQRDPATYGHAALTGSYPTCESHVVSALTDLLAKRRAYAEHDGERFLDAEQNARLVANAERYYRIMYYGSRASWNLRDTICSKR
jgi:hypothetical protein